jgi:hypothetical protein
VIIGYLNSERLHVMRLNSGCMPVPCSFPRFLGVTHHR